MALLTKQQAAITGTTITFGAAAGGGDTVDVTGGDVYLLVKNDDATAKTVTVVRPGSEYGQANPDIAKSVAAGAIAIIGPIPADFEDPTTGVVNITYSAVTSVTVAAVRG